MHNKKMFIKYLSLGLFLNLCISIPGIILWPNHDIKTLRLLQVVHRHGERTPVSFMPNDPFSNLTKYWYQGLGELTIEGKYRMYKIGQFIRDEYQQYLGDYYSPREVYVRSSLSHRCIESSACLMAGAYPPNNTKWQWNTGSDAELGIHWQPFPIETFMPRSDDNLLVIDKQCPNAEYEMNKIFNSDKVTEFLSNYSGFLTEFNKYNGMDVSSLLIANRVYENLLIESNNGYLWSDMNIWSPEYEKLVFKTLEPIARYLWIVEWDNRRLQRLRAGNLINELINNFKDKIVNKTDKKLIMYSTHDSMMAVFMHALRIYNNEFIPIGASIILELHENLNNNYFIKIYYFNETLPEKSPYLLTLPDCGNQTDCPFDSFVDFTKDVVPVDWDSECGLVSDELDCGQLHVVNIVILILNIVLVIVLGILIVYNINLARDRIKNVT